MNKSRGFSALKGVTISAVDAAAVNQVVLLDATGEYIYTIDVESPAGIPILSLSKQKNHKYKKAKGAKKNDGSLVINKARPSKSPFVSKEAAWPWPMKKD